MIYCDLSRSSRGKPRSPARQAGPTIPLLAGWPRLLCNLWGPQALEVSRQYVLGQRIQRMGMPTVRCCPNRLELVPFPLSNFRQNAMTLPLETGRSCSSPILRKPAYRCTHLPNQVRSTLGRCAALNTKNSNTDSSFRTLMTENLRPHAESESVSSR